jgi:antitoxin VapB
MQAVLAQQWIFGYLLRIFNIRDPMPLYIKDDATAALVEKLAKHRGVTKQDAVRQAVQAELDRIKEAVPLRERLEAFWREHPLPPLTGEKADKAFFDELSGEL